MNLSISPVPEDIDEFEAPNSTSRTQSQWDDLSSDEGSPSFGRLRPRPRRLSDSIPGVHHSLEAHIFKEEAGPMLSITHNGSHDELRLPLAGQSCALLTRLCGRLVGCRDIEIYYWNPLFRYWTEALARKTLHLMKMDVKDRDVVHVFVLRPWEKAADLPFMRVDGFLLGEVVPIKGRRERKLATRGFGVG